MTNSSPVALLRVVVLGVAVAWVYLLWPVAMIGLTFTATSWVVVGLPLALAVIDVPLLRSAGLFARPLPPGATELETRRRTLIAVRAATLARLTVATGPASLGLLGSLLLSHSLVPAAVGAGASVALLLGLVYPRRGVLSGLRGRLESDGVLSHLDEALGWAGPR